MASTEPINFLLLVFGFWKSDNLDTVVEEGFFLGEIDEIEFYFLVFFGVCHTKEKPLIISFGVDIILYNKIIFLFRDPEHSE